MRATLLLALIVSVFILPGGACSGSKNLGDGGACDCRVVGTGDSARVLMSWACYCATHDCTRTLAGGCGPGVERVDFPGCGLSALNIEPAGGPILDFFDDIGNLVGVVDSSGTEIFACPSDPAMFGHSLQAGRLPGAGCPPTTCGSCSAEALPCAATR